MKNGMILAVALTALGAHGETVKTATQPWVRNYVATNRTSLTPATNYTDKALADFASTGAVARATVYGTPTRFTDPTGCVWDVVTNVWFDHRDGNIFVNGVSIFPSETTAGDMKGYLYYDPSAMEYIGETGGGWYHNGENTSGTPGVLAGGPDATSLDSGNLTLGNLTNLVGRVALTNDIPDVSGYATQQQATNAATAVADTKISTNNAAFVEAVTNCPVVIASGGGGGGGFPAGDWSDYGTLGALLAAIIAAITWLKNNQRYALHTVTLTNGAGTLLDRAGNRVVVSGDTTLTLPAAVPGYLRDFLVRLEISGSTVPTIIFAAPTGETITYETDGDEFPVPDETGTWSYSFTENCVAHKFAVSLKKVQTVAQGGA